VILVYYEDIGEYMTTEFICENSRSFFEKLEYGCYNEFFELLLFLICCYIFIRTFVWILTKLTN